MTRRRYLMVLTGLLAGAAWWFWPVASAPNKAAAVRVQVKPTIPTPVPPGAQRSDDVPPDSADATAASPVSLPTSEIQPVADNPPTEPFVVLPVPATDNLPPGVYNPNRLATSTGAIPINEPVPSSKATPAAGTLVHDAHLAALKAFADKKNPDGPWEYGWSKGLTDPLVPFSSIEQSKQDNGQQAVWFDPANYYNVTPTVRYNFGPDFSNGDVTFKSGALLLTPGYGSRACFVHAVWTAPEDGTYNISCAFYGQQKGINVEVDVLVRGAPVFTDALTVTGDSRSYSSDVRLAAGDAVDFAVGPRQGYLATGLDALITKK